MEIRHETFCTNCYTKVPYHLAFSTEVASVREVTFSYEKTTALCDICGKEVYVPAVNDRNVYERHKAYYKELGELKNGTERL